MKKVDIVGIDTSSLPKLSNAQTIEMLQRIRKRTPPGFVWENFGSSNRMLFSLPTTTRFFPA